jgi:hypothetical protein
MPIAVFRGLAAIAVLACGLGLAGCASMPRAQPVVADFSGGWSVQWCDRANPALDCGGFELSLIQHGDRLCGDFGGALVNLRQVDEGKVTGIVVGSVAILTVESMRNQSIVLVRAELDRGGLRWKEVGTVRKGEGDNAIIASDETLTRTTAPVSVTGEMPQVDPRCYTSSNDQ